MRIGNDLSLYTMTLKTDYRRFCYEHEGGAAAAGVRVVEKSASLFRIFVQIVSGK